MFFFSSSGVRYMHIHQHFPWRRLELWCKDGVSLIHDIIFFKLKPKIDPRRGLMGRSPFTAASLARALDPFDCRDRKLF